MKAAVGALGALMLLLAAVPPVAQTVPSSDFRPVIGEHGGIDPRLKAVWRDEVDGWLIDLRTARPALFNQTSADCLRDRASSTEILDYIATYWRSEGGGIRLTADPELPGARFVRIAALPANCVRPTAPTPENVFNSLVASYADRYPHFAERNVDWNSIVADARTRLRPDMADLELFDLLTSMLRPLDDSHVTLSNPKDPARYFEEGQGKTLNTWFDSSASPGHPDRTKMRPAFMNDWIGSVQKDLLRGKGMETANRRLHAGFVGPGIGYIAPATFYDTAPGMGWREARDDYARVLDHIFTQFAGARALIIDLSNNRGGNPDLGRAIVSRVAPVAATGAFFQADRFAGSEPDPFTVTPERERPRFDGPVYVLISDITVSAGEFTTLLLRALPNTLIVGDRTRGSLSSLTEKVLPNGWVMEMAHLSLVTPDGENFAGSGIPPEVPHDVYGGGDPFASHRRAVRTIVDRIASCDASARAPKPCW